MFYLYQIHQLNATAEKWTRIRPVRLSGPTGPLATHIRRLAGGEAEAWALPGTELAAAITAGIGSFGLIYDPDPDNPTHVSLSLLAKIAGCTRETHSDVLLVFELLWNHRKTEDPQGFKSSFWLEKNARRKEHSEAIAITGGTNPATSTWKLTNPSLSLGTAVVG